MASPERAYIRQLLEDNEVLEKHFEALARIASTMSTINRLEGHPFPGPPLEGENIDLEAVLIALTAHLKALQEDQKPPPSLIPRTRQVKNNC